MPDSIYEKIFDLAKRRGFLYPAYELYGGAAGFYDYGPLGAQLKALVEAKFRQIYVVEEGAAEINTPAITVESVLKASGHVDHFSDVVLTCEKCGNGLRADHFYKEEIPRIKENLEKAAGLANDVKARFAGYLDSKLRLISEKPTVAVAEELRTTCVIHDQDEFKILPYSEAVSFDPELKTKETVQRPRAIFKAKNLAESFKCLTCRNDSFQPATNFNLMFKTHVGPGTSKVAYLRPETAQAMFVDFPFLYRYFREQLPFAACQLGRAYRNEIAPRQGLIRLREFNQMEVEAFFDPGGKPEKMTHPNWRKVQKTVLNLVPNATQQMEAMSIVDAVKKKIVFNAAIGYHLVLVQRLLAEVGLDPKRLRFRQHLKDEMAHYARDCWDAEYESARFGWVECVGVAYRTDFDLSQHEKHSRKTLKALRRYPQPVTRERQRVVAIPAKLGPLFKRDAPRVQGGLNALDEKAAAAAEGAPHVEVVVDGTTHRVPRDAYEVRKETETLAGDAFVPHVIEPSYGVDRILYAILEHNYRETSKEGEPYTILALPPAMAPITVGVFALMPKDGLDTQARKVEEKLKGAGFRIQYDESGAIGRRYARADEIGTPYCVTIDYDTLKDKTVTLRDRDTTAQVRVPIGRLAGELRARLARPAPASAT